MKEQELLKNVENKMIISNHLKVTHHMADYLPAIYVSHDYISIPGDKDSRIDGKDGEGGSSDYGSTKNGPAWEGEHVPYEEVISEYEKSAYEGIESGKYPPGMEDIIREYFGNLVED